VNLGYLIVAVVAAAVAVFALQNSAPASVRFIVWSIEAVPVAALVLLSLAAGIVVAGVPLWLQRWRLRARARALEQRVAELERTSAARTAPPRVEPPRAQAAGD
jgi:putative membrane protein